MARAIGIMFLLFLVGIELSLARLWTMRRYVLGAGGMQFALTAATVGFLVALALSALLGLYLKSRIAWNKWPQEDSGLVRVENRARTSDAN